MRITANQVTFVRLLLLPVPIAMLYRGGTLWSLAALAVFVALGLTDAIDGILARRYGVTQLGALLDPIADKIFLVATFGPMADLRIMPPSLAVVIFVRELAVTGLRSIAGAESVAFRTSRIAKLKATVQMAGAGFILLIHMFRDPGAIGWILWAAAFASWLPPAFQGLRGRAPGWRAWSGAALITGVAIARLWMPPEATIVALMWTIVAFTVYSGAEYFWDMRRVVWARFRRSPLGPLRLAGLSLAVPLCFLPAMQWPGAPTYAILLVLAAEIGVGGVDNYLVHAGVERAPWGDLLRSGIQAACGVAMLALLWREPVAIVPVHLVANFALAATLFDLGHRIVRSRRLFLDAVTGGPSRPRT